MNLRYEGILVDIDGTLVDSNDAHASAWVDALAEHGHSVPFERVRPLIGMGGDKLLEAVASLSDDSPEGKAIAERRGALFKSNYLHTLRPTPGAQRLVQWLIEVGFRVI